MSEKKKGWPEIGILVKNEVRKKRKDGTFENVLDKNGNKIYNLQIKLNPGVELTIDGEPVDLNKHRTVRLQSPVQEVNTLYKAGYISEKDFPSRLEKAKEVNSWLRYRLVVPPSES